MLTALAKLPGASAWYVARTADPRVLHFWDLGPDECLVLTPDELRAKFAAWWNAYMQAKVESRPVWR